ncbi:MAG: hypothetical protein RLZZ350_2020 [Verrucomicrobiota bacterium]|jgi:hypothetical protein
MKNKFLSLVSCAALVVLAVGCINTVTGNKKAAWPFLRDRVAARYERPLDKVTAAATTVLMRNGTIGTAGSLHNQTNAVNILEGKARQCNVWIRLEAIEPRLTEVTVQTRTTAGVTDQVLAQELDKEIALELAH